MPEAATPEAPFADCLAAAAAAIEAAHRLGLDTTALRSALATANERLSLPVESFVVAFVGGTGVGKSSLLNALVGATVSEAGVRRPTTARPVAVVAGDEPGLDEVLAWLGVEAVRRAPVPRASDGGAGSLALIDLPDLDSIDVAHRARVEELLPRLDAVVWVVDPEKYADAVLHDAFLRPWARRLGRQLVVLNKADLVAPADRSRVVADLRRLLAAASVELPVATTTATDGPGGTAELRRWVGELAAAKAVALRRQRASIAAALGDLASVAGVPRGYEPLVPARRRRTAADETARRLAAAADVTGLRSAAVAGTARTALDDTGPLAVFRRVAAAGGLGGSRPDLRRHLERWRDRGPLLGAAEPAAGALGETLAGAPPALRPRLAEIASPLAVARRLEPVLDAVPASLAPDELAVPSGRGWAALGLLRAAAAGVAVVAVAWLAASAFFRLPSPIDGSGLVGVAVVGVLGGLLLRLAVRQHARFLGRRWGDRLARRVESEIAARVDSAAFGPLDELDGARRALAEAAGRCRSGTPAP